MLLAMDGFDTYTAYADMALLGYFNGGVLYQTIDPAGGRFGGGALTSNTFRLCCRAPLARAASELWFGCAFKTSGSNKATVFTVTNAAGTDMCCISLTAANVPFVVKGDPGSSSVLATGPVSIAANAWHWIEARVKLHSFAGEVEVWVDGVQVISVTGVNTTNGASDGTAAWIGLGPYNDSGSVFYGFWDDFYACDLLDSAPVGRLGDSKIETLVPTSDASPNDGTVSTGTTHYGVVDEAQFNSTDYTTLNNTAGQAETFGMLDLSYTPKSVAAVRTIAVASKTGTDDASFTMEVANGGSSKDGAAHALGTTATPFVDIFTVDPSTNAAWTGAGVNAMTVAYKVS
jgi:hypothetical protein